MLPFLDTFFVVMECLVDEWGVEFDAIECRNDLCLVQKPCYLLRFLLASYFIGEKVDDTVFFKGSSPVERNYGDVCALFRFQTRCLNVVCEKPHWGTSQLIHSVVYSMYVDKCPSAVEFHAVFFQGILGRVHPGTAWKVCVSQHLGNRTFLSVSVVPTLLIVFAMPASLLHRRADLQLLFQWPCEDVVVEGLYLACCLLPL